MTEKCDYCGKEMANSEEAAKHYEEEHKEDVEWDNLYY